MNKHKEIAGLLIELEAALKSQALWSEQQPSAEDLVSTQPFCVDTLNFSQWLQFVFIQRLGQIILMQGTLPAQCDVYPMAEEYFKPQPIDADKIKAVIKSIDNCLNGK